MILRAVGYTIAIFVVATTLTMLVLLATHSVLLVDLTFPVSIFLGILAFLIDEQKRQTHS